MSLGIRFLWFLTVCFHLFTFPLVFLSAGAFAFVFAIDCCCLYPFSSVCFCLIASLRSCAGLHRLLVGSDATVAFVGISCDDPSCNKQMAHSQIAVVIAFS